MYKPGDKMKRAANFLDRNKIKTLAEQGYSTHEISEWIQVDEQVVRNFMPKGTVEPEPEDEKDTSE